MICPNCGGDTEEIYIIDEHKDSFEIDRCSHCGGIWLDRGEMDRVPQDRAEEVDQPGGGSEEVDLLGLNCPHCFVPLEQFRHPKLGDITLWRCPDCHGFWLRRGQLAQYCKVKRPSQVNQPDALGTLTRRDRVLVTFSSLLLIAMLAGFILGLRTGNLQLAADVLRQQNADVPLIWVIILILDLVIFAGGLILALFRAHKLIRLMGWSLVFASIIILVYLSRV